MSDAPASSTPEVTQAPEWVGLQDDYSLLSHPPAPPPLQLSQATPQTFVGVGIALAIIAAGIIIWRIGRRTNWTFRRPEPAERIALRELKAWQSLQYEAQMREAIAAISGTLRRYVRARFKLPADQLTHEEFWLKQRTERLLPQTYEGFWEDFLPHTDLIIYAGQQPARAQFQALLKSAETFVQHSATSTKQAA